MTLIARFLGAHERLDDRSGFRALPFDQEIRID